LNDLDVADFGLGILKALDVVDFGFGML